LTPQSPHTLINYGYANTPYHAMFSQIVLKVNKQMAGV